MGRPWMGERLAKGTASRARALKRIRSWGRWTQAFVRESREEMWVRREVAYDSIVRLPERIRCRAWVAVRWWGAVVDVIFG
jgi:hypothetical protein